MTTGRINQVVSCLDRTKLDGVNRSIIQPKKEYVHESFTLQVAIAHSMSGDAGAVRQE